MLEISIPLHINLTLENEFSLVNLAEKIHDLEIDKVLLKDFVEKYDDMLTTQLCGEKYSHNNEKRRYRRAGTYKRKITTILGEMVLQVNKIKDTVTGEIFKPVLEKLDVGAYKNYQEDISLVSADIATKSSYRDTVYNMKKFFKNTLSPSTINRRVIGLGKEIKEFIKHKNTNEENVYDILFVDGTKSHSQEKGIIKNDITVAMTIDKNGEKLLCSCNVNKNMTDTYEEIEKTNLISDEAVIIADAEAEIRNTFVKAERHYQLDIIHYIRDIGYNLWKDHRLSLKTRKNIIKKVKTIIYTLKNQTEKYAKDQKSLKKKINQTIDKLKELSQYLQELGCEKAAKFIKKHSNHTLTYAILTLQGKTIPWTSNIIERLMGEIQKRCKHKWMRWTTEGQESILNLILLRYTNPKDYKDFQNQKLKRKNKKNIKIQLIKPKNNYIKNT
jgi:hypothetical protein